MKISRVLCHTCLFVLSLAVCVSCGEARTDEEAPSTEQVEQPPTETGNCKNENVEGMCSFLVAFQAPGHSKNGLGTVLYRLQHQIAVKGEDRTIDLISADLLIPEDRAEDLRKYYRENSPVPCKAYIIRPPCNPQGTSVSLEIDPPEFAKPGRY